MAGLKGVSEESDVISERRQRALQLSELAVQLREEGREQRKKGGIVIIMLTWINEHNSYMYNKATR